MISNLALAEELDQEIYDNGINVEEFDTTDFHVDGLYYNSDDLASPVITLNSTLTEREKNSIKAHELGHHNYCVCNLFEAPQWIQRKYETLADRYKLERIMPVEKLLEAFDNGDCAPMALADFLEITLEELASGIKLYQQIYGISLTRGQYTITWQPFKITKDKRQKCY